MECDRTLHWLPEVRRIMSAVMAVPGDDIGPDTVPNDVPAWDSLEHLNLVVALEEALAVRFSAADIERMTSVAAICAVVAFRRGDAT